MLTTNRRFPLFVVLAVALVGWTSAVDAESDISEVEMRRVLEDVMELEEAKEYDTQDLQGLTLLSRNKPAFQSSSYTHVGHVVSASMGNDGNYNQNFGGTPSQFCTHTLAELNPWWKVDLQGEFSIRVLRIWNRVDCCSNRLFPFKVETSRNGNDWVVCAEVADGAGRGNNFYVPCKATARFVRIVSTKNTAEYLTLCEVEIWGQQRNECPIVDRLLSLNKPAEQSSSYTHLGHVVSAQRANDGRYSQIFGSTPETFCSHTLNEVHPWWRVDLGEVHQLTRVKIWNRADCCGERLLPLQVDTSVDGVNWKMCGEKLGRSANGDIFSLPCEARARYVRVTITKGAPEYLTICEIEVWGRNKAQSCCANGGRLLSRNKPAEQSTSYVHLGYTVSALRGNDGNYNQVFGSTPEQFCTHTNAELNPWWQVDLQGVFNINRVKIWNRADCCGNRLTPLKVETSVDKLNWEVCGTLEEQSVNGMVYSVPCAANARYVRVTITKSQAEYLTICELEVWGCGGREEVEPVKPVKPGKHEPHYIMSTWYSSGPGWISTYFTRYYEYSTVNGIDWVTSYFDRNRPDVFDRHSYTTGDIFGSRMYSRVLTSVITYHVGPGWVSSGEYTWTKN